MLVVLPGRPIPKARPRPGRNGRFYVPSQEEQAMLAMLMGKHRGKFVRGDLIKVETEFHFAGGRRPGDIDNLVKLVLDAAQDAQIFPNDLQIVEVESRIVRPARRDQTVIRFSRLDSAPVSLLD